MSGFIYSKVICRASQSPYYKPRHGLTVLILQETHHPVAVFTHLPSSDDLVTEQHHFNIC